MGAIARGAPIQKGEAPLPVGTRLRSNVPLAACQGMVLRRMPQR